MIGRKPTLGGSKMDGNKKADVKSRKGELERALGFTEIPKSQCHYFKS